MSALIFGILSLLTFFVPLLCPAFALLSAGCAVGPLRRRRRRGLAVAGLALAVVAVLLQVWVWRFGQLPSGPA